MSKIQIKFNHNNPNSFNRVNIYRSLNKNYMGKLIKSFPKSRLMREGNLFVCNFIDKEIGMRYYNVSVASESFCTSSNPISENSSITTFEQNVESVYDSALDALVKLEKSLKRKISQKISYLKRKTQLAVNR
jgi:uncharacterized protein (DUF2164 family)